MNNLAMLRTHVDNRRDKPEVTNCSERGRMLTQKSTDQKVVSRKLSESASRPTLLGFPALHGRFLDLLAPTPGTSDIAVQVVLLPLPSSTK